MTQKEFGEYLNIPQDDPKLELGTGPPPYVVELIKYLKKGGKK